jgi:hypothetical protein
LCQKQEAVREVLQSLTKVRAFTAFWTILFGCLRLFDNACMIECIFPSGW